MLARLFQASEEAPLLLLLRDVQKEFQHDCAIAGEMALETPDRFEPMLPDILVHEARRRPLAVEPVRMDAHDQDLLVMGSVENADPAATGEAPRRPPEEIVIE